MSGIFSFKGRIGRAHYWRLTGLCMLAFTAAYFLIILAITYTSAGLDVVSAIAAIAGIVVFFATWVVLLGAGVRRLHDRGKSGFWIILYYLVPFILAFLAIDPEGPRMGLRWIALAILAWTMIDLGILRAKSAGRDPTAARTDG